jgi:phosphinothricin acetyltransferase
MLRDARESDLPAIVAIYNEAVAGRLATADTEPVTVESRRAWLRDRDFARYPVWVWEREGQVAAWLSLTRFYGRPAYVSTAEVGVYVDPGARRTGVATRLLEAAVTRGPELGLRTILALVFAHNEPSLALFRRFGFTQWGHLPRVAQIDDIERDVVILGQQRLG